MFPLILAHGVPFLFIAPLLLAAVFSVTLSPIAYWLSFKPEKKVLALLAGFTALISSGGLLLIFPFDSEALVVWTIVGLLPFISSAWSIIRCFRMKSTPENPKV